MSLDYIRVLYATSVFFNLSSVAEPFAAILIAHRTLVFWGSPERGKKGRNSRSKAETGEGVLEEMLASPSPRARESVAL